MEKEHNQAVRRHTAYSRGTGGGPPTPPVPGKFFNDRTLNALTLNDQTLKLEWPDFEWPDFEWPDFECVGPKLYIF